MAAKSKVTSAKQNGNGVNGTSPRDAFPPRDVPENPFTVRLSLKFIVSSVIIVSALAFSVGRFSMEIVLRGIPIGNLTSAVSDGLPQPQYLPGKEIPHTVYSAKHYDTGAKATASDLLARRKDFGLEPPEEKKTVQVNESGETDAAEEVHEPAGQHLLIDIKNVDGTFLNSAKGLARAMIDLVELSGLTLLSYHCHTLEPVGVSCVGVLLESHISYHTWPIEGVITLDLFTCGEGQLRPLLPVIEKLFAVPRSTVEKPHIQWAHKKRGYRIGVHNPEEIDINQFMLGWMEFDLKRRVAEQATDYQTVEIYDVINPRFKSKEWYEKSLMKDGNYFAQNKELFRPDRIVYLDGIMQSRLYGETSYHEALVHPAMIAHPNPKRVAIIGGGEGATLREVLKHNTVETVTMIEIDEMMVQVSREYLPEWSNCSNFVGRAASCFDDPRAEVYYRDAISWFVDKFADESKIDEAEKYDIIIMDALDPSGVVEFSDVLYKNNELTRAFYNGLTDGGIFVNQFGEATFSVDPGPHLSHKNADIIFLTNLERVGFESIVSYQEAHGGFLGIWSFLVAMKVKNAKSDWLASQATVDLKLQQRAVATVDGSFPFKYFDGATMAGYQYSSRIDEENHCRLVPKPLGCDGHGFDPERQNVPISSLEVKESTVFSKGLGLYAKTDISQGSYFAIEETVTAILFKPGSSHCIQILNDARILSKWTTLWTFMNEFGLSTGSFGRKAFSVVPSLALFLNHGCGGTQNVGRVRYGSPSSPSEATADPDQVPLLPTVKSVHNPFFRRNVMATVNSEDVFLRDVRAGEEILGSDLAHFFPDDWKEELLSIRAKCEAARNAQSS